MLDFMKLGIFCKVNSYLVSQYANNEKKMFEVHAISFQTFVVRAFKIIVDS